MKAPKCKTCGRDHFGLCTGLLPPPPKVKAKPKANGADPKDAQIAGLKARVAELEGVVAQYKADAEATAKRREAQKERMRERRGGLRRAPREEAI